MTHSVTCLLFSGMYYKHITIVNDDSRVVGKLMLQIVASLMIVILITLEVSFMFLESSIMLLNIFSTVITHDDLHLQSLYFYSTEQISYSFSDWHKFIPDRCSTLWV
jgi:hypothetical protein